MNNFEQGFIDKCAEYNVNPEALVKQAGLMDILRRYGALLTGSGAKQLSGKLSGLKNTIHGNLSKLEATAKKDPAIKELIDEWFIHPAQRYSNPDVKSLKDISIRTLGPLTEDARNFIDSMEYQLNNASTKGAPKLSVHEERLIRKVPKLLPGNELAQAMELTRDLTAEKIKSQAVRLGTGVAGVGAAGLGGYGLYKGLTNN